jgi:ribosomal protein S18 acetylase RimI-like enzyme
MEIVRLERSRLADASAVLARAFQDDPAWVWLFPDAERRERLLPWLFRIGFDVTAADVYATAGEILGAARWLPPGRAAIHVGPTLRALVATPLRLGAATPQFLAYGRAVEALRAEVAGGPHWYLAGIGVDPAAQRRGVGGALLQPGIDGARKSGVPAVLLTNNEANLSFYEGHGFHVVRKGETPRGGPEAWAMVTKP